MGRPARGNRDEPAGGRATLEPVQRQRQAGWAGERPGMRTIRLGEWLVLAQNRWLAGAAACLALRQLGGGGSGGGNSACGLKALGLSSAPLASQMKPPPLARECSC